MGVALTVGVLLVFVTAAWLGLALHRTPGAEQAPADVSGGNATAKPGTGDPSRILVARHWAVVLERLDRRRDQAWRRGRPHDLRQVFTIGSSALYADRAAMRGYLQRGYTVGGARVRFWDVQVQARRAGVVQLDVIDRLEPVSVAGAAGTWTPLPADRPTRHLITLAATRAGWRISQVRAS